MGGHVTTEREDSTMQRIMERDDLRALANTLGVRPDWHEPDEQELTARVEGQSFDNAGFWPLTDEDKARYGAHPPHEEMHVILTQDGKDVASVNLATLLSWACK